MAQLVLKLDMVQTLALAAVVLFAGYAIRRRIGVLDRFNIPAPVVGGFVFAAVALLLRLKNVVAFEFDTALQPPLMIAFFTTIGLGASLGLLKVGGPQVLLFWILSSLLAFAQNAVGVGLAKLLCAHPLLGLVAGSITMTGGHGTGAAFGKLLEERFAFSGGLTLAMAAATFGLISGGLIGGPVATLLIRRRHLAHPALAPNGVGNQSQARALANEHVSCDDEVAEDSFHEPLTAYRLLKVITIVLVAMWLGSLLSRHLGQSITLPTYIGAMAVAAVIRNLGDITGLVRVEPAVVDELGTIALSLFLAMALMTLRLWELFDLAIPLLVILTAQVAMMGTFAYFVTFRLMGRDYDAAVMAGGHCGFGLGATPSAVANMEAITERFGPAPRAFLVVPMVGAFFIDFTNALIITFYLNLLT